MSVKLNSEPQPSTSSDDPVEPFLPSSLPLKEVEEQIALLSGNMELEEKRRALRRKVENLESLRLANQAPRCAYLKSNGKTCQAPALGGRQFCVFHVRALDQNAAPRMQVTLLEDRQSIQLTLKQIMEQLVLGHINPQTASLLLRGVQIAGATIKSQRIQARSVRGTAATKIEKAPDALTSTVEDLTEEELDAKMAELESEIAELKQLLTTENETREG